MFADNPFIPATNFLPPLLMQIYVALMVVAMATGTVFDLYHKRSARFFAQQRTRSRAHRPGQAQRPDAEPGLGLIGRLPEHARSIR